MPENSFSQLRVDTSIADLHMVRLAHRNTDPVQSIADLLKHLQDLAIAILDRFSSSTTRSGLGRSIRHATRDNTAQE